MSFQKKKKKQSNHKCRAILFVFNAYLHTHIVFVRDEFEQTISYIFCHVSNYFIVCFFSFGTLELHGVTSSVRLSQRKARRWDTNKENKTKFDSNLWKVIPLVFRTWRTNDLSTFKKTPRDIFTVYVWTSSETFSRVYSFQLQLLI